MSIDRIAETMTDILTSTFVRSAISISSFLHDVIVIPFTLCYGHTERAPLPMPRSSDYLPGPALGRAEAANHRGGIFPALSF